MFEVSWVGVCRLFDLLESNIDIVKKGQLNVYHSLYLQCSKEQQDKLRELYPNSVRLLNNIYGESHVYKGI